MNSLINGLIGIPFLDGGRDPKTGLDCWGLVRIVYQRLGYGLPMIPIPAYNSDEINREFERQTEIDWDYSKTPIVNSVIGIRFNSDKVNHFGVYLGYGDFIHAREGTKSCKERIDSPHWRCRIEGYYLLRGAKYENQNIQ